MNVLNPILGKIPGDFFAHRTTSLGIIDELMSYVGEIFVFYNKCLELSKPNAIKELE